MLAAEEDFADTGFAMLGFVVDPGHCERGYDAEVGGTGSERLVTEQVEVRGQERVTVAEIDLQN